MTVRILLVDDHSVVREGYRRLIERDPGLVVVGEASSAEAAYKAFCEIGADVVVVDISLPGASGLDAMLRIRAREPSTRFVVCSMHEDPIYVEKSLEFGADAYVSKVMVGDVLLRAIRAALSGSRYISDDLLPALTQWRARRSRSAPEFNAREIEILRMLVQGYLIEDIGRTLKISEKTVSNYQSQLRQKLGARNTMQLVSAAKQLGVVREGNLVFRDAGPVLGPRRGEDD